MALDQKLGKIIDGNHQGIFVILVLEMFEMGVFPVGLP